MKYLMALVLLVGCSAAHATDSRYTRIDKTLAVAAGTPVRIVNVSGAIRVVGTSAATLHVTGDVGASVERVDVVSANGVAEVRVVVPKNTYTSGKTDAELQIEMPATSRLETSTVSADQSVSGLRAAVLLTSVSGDVTAEALASDVQIKTVSGDVRLTGTDKPSQWTIKTVSGDITVSHGAGSLEIGSVSGDMRISFEQLSAARVRTTSGDLTLRGRAQRGAEVSVESVSGDARLSLGTDAGLAIEASAFSGDLRTCFGEEGKSGSEYTTSTTLNTRRGEGGVNVKVKTLSGDVTICDRL